MKYTALKNASVRTEREIYLYRTKTGHYSVTKKKKISDDDQKNDDDDDEDDDEDDGHHLNPRKMFSTSLDLIWADLATSDLQNGSLQNPLASDLVLSEINQRIRSNRQEQNTYLRLMQPNLNKNEGGVGGGGKKKSVLPIDKV